MFNLHTADTIVSGGAFILAYLFSVTIAGALTARIIAALGDKTAQTLGFTIPNPLIHIDILGFICFLITGLGWGQRIPVDTNQLGYRFHKLRVLGAFLAESVVHILLALISITSLILYLGPGALRVTMPMFAFYDLLTFRILTQAYPALSSLNIVLAFIIVSMVFVNTMCATLSFLMNGFRYTTDLLITRYGGLGRYTELIMLFVPLALIFIFGSPLRIFIIKSVCKLGSMLGSSCAA